MKVADPILVDADVDMVADPDMVVDVAVNIALRVVVQNVTAALTSNLV